MAATTKTAPYKVNAPYSDSDAIGTQETVITITVRYSAINYRSHWSRPSRGGTRSNKELWWVFFFFFCLYFSFANVCSHDIIILRVAIINIIRLTWKRIKTDSQWIEILVYFLKKIKKYKLNPVARELSNKKLSNHLLFRVRHPNVRSYLSPDKIILSSVQLYFSMIC